MAMLILKNCDANNFFMLFFNMAFKTRVFIHRNLEDYDQRCITRSRIFDCDLWRLFTVITYIRFILPAILAKQWVIDMVSSPFQLMFDHNTAVDDPNLRIMHFVYSMGPLIILILLLILQTTELNYTNSQYDFIVNYLKKKLLPLSDRNDRKLLIRLNIVRITLFNVAFIPLLIFITTTVIALNIESYLNVKYNFTLISIIFFNFSFIFFVIQLLALISLAVTVCAFTVLYIRYKFREINDKFLFCLRSKNFSHLQIIDEYNHICKLIEDINQVYKLFIFILYYLANPSIMAMIKLGQQDNVTQIAKIFNAILIVVIFGGCFFANLFSSRVSKASILPLKYLHRFMTENQLPLKERLKTMEMIERLSGPDIGFYCYDLFPMNSYEFYIYVANCCKNYFLIESLL